MQQGMVVGPCRDSLFSFRATLHFFGQSMDVCAPFGGSLFQRLPVKVEHAFVGIVGIIFLISCNDPSMLARNPDLNLAL